MRLAALAFMLLALPVAAQDLSGHGGPVSALDAGAQGVVSGGFDGRVILWNADDGSAARIEHFHSGNVSAVSLVSGGFASAGQDGRVALWRAGHDGPVWATPPGLAPVTVLAYADGALAAGFGDGRIGRIEIADGGLTTFDAHDGRVTGLAFMADGTLVSVGADLRFARWGAGDRLLARSGLPGLPNGLARVQDVLAVPFADGNLQLMSADGAMLPERFLTDRPLVAVASAPGTVAAAAVDGSVWLLDLPFLTSRAEVPGGAGPVWALAFDEDELFAAGAQGVVRRFSLADGRPLGAVQRVDEGAGQDGSRGAEVWRACAICHSLAPGDHSRAGPSLHGLFGRRIASVEGFSFSPALRELSIIWTPETLSALFEQGPEAYTPGSRMPDQRIADPEDRAALAEYLAQFAP